MGFDLRYPNITAPDERGQLIQMKSYLHQLVEQLQWALNSTDAQSNSPVVASKRNGVANTDANGTIDRAATFNAIKSLIITSADIVEAYYEEINKKLSGLYVAESDFGTFVEATNNSISANSTRIDQTYSDTQTVIGDLSVGLGGVKETADKISGDLSDVSGKVEDVAGSIDGVTNDIKTVGEKIDGVSDRLDSAEGTLSEVTLYVKTTKANIKSGLLYYDAEGTPIYGVEVGQENEINGETVFRKYARFISNRLSFYDENDNEVAYISDRKLYITDVEITGSYKIGSLRDYVSSRGSVVTKWIGA